MMKRPVLFCCLCIFLLVAAGCYYDKASLVYPQNPVCDTTDITLSTDINAILSANCFGCHGGDAAAGAGIRLSEYSVLKAYVDNGRLLSAITHDGNASFMPKDAEKLSDCDINKFRAWINDGAPNN